MQIQELSSAIVRFSHVLRANGIRTTVSEEMDALRALQALHHDIGDQQSFRLSLRAVFAKSLRETEIFDKAFAAHFRHNNRDRHDNEPNDSEADDVKDEHSNDDDNQQKKQGTSAYKTLADWLNQNDRGDDKDEEEEERMPSYSPTGDTMGKDFSQLTTDELSEVARLIAVIAKSITLKTSRRFKPTRKKIGTDLRRTVRLSLRRGGEITELLYHKRKVEKLKMVMLCDVSKSMDVYSEFLIQFMYAFQNLYQRLETFCFATSLHLISPHLRRQNIKQALATLASVVPDWSGGTRIGASLEDFVQNYAQTLLDKRTIVLILSDGWDTGEIEILEQAMAEIHNRAGCVLWLNPLAGSDSYEPTCQGMAAALPYVDIFAPAHNLTSLTVLSHHLATARRHMR